MGSKLPGEMKEEEGDPNLSFKVDFLPCSLAQNVWEPVAVSRAPSDTDSSSDLIYRTTLCDCLLSERAPKGSRR